MFSIFLRQLFAVALLTACFTVEVFAQSEDPTTLNNKVSELIRAGRYADAKPIADKALQIATTQNALPRIKAAALDSRALLYKFDRDFTNAEKLYKEALDIQRSLPAQPNPDLPTAFNNLGLLFDAKDEYQKAEKHFLRAIDLWEKLPDERNAYVGKHNLAIAYNHLGHFEKSEALFLGVISYREKDKDFAGLAHAYNNLGLLYENQGKYKKAESSYKKALESATKAYGDAKHPIFGRIRQNLGGLHKSLERRGEARLELQTALEIFEQAYGKNSEWLVPILTQLGDLARLDDNRTCNESQSYYARARNIDSGSIRYIPVLFATDRERETKTGKVAFGDGQSDKVTVGTIVVPLAMAPPLTVLKSGKSDRSHGGHADAAQRLPQECANVIDDLPGHLKSQGGTSSRQAMIFVHGYYVTFDNAIKRAAEIAYKIKFEGDVYVFSWPSQGSLWDYFFDSEVVEAAAPHLHQFLDTVLNNGKISKLHFIAHSMGSKLLMRALDRAINKDTDLRSRIGEIIFASPDVYAKSFTQQAKFITTSENAGATASGTDTNKITLYAAKSDLALRLSSWLWGHPRAGLIYGEPLTGSGFDTIDVTNGGERVWHPFNLNHDIFAESPVVIGDIRRIVELGTRPPHERTKTFQQAQTKSGATYWQIRP